MELSATAVGLRLLAVLALVAANGLFVAAEFAIVRARHTRVAQLVRQGRPFARVVQRAVQNPDPYVAATQLGITMASLGLGWIGKPAVATVIEPLLLSLPGTLREVTLHSISATLAFTFITVLHIVLGELAPKSLALWNAEATALVVVPPTDVFYRVFRPFIWALNTIANRTLRIFGLRAPGGRHVAFGREELVMLVGESRRAGTVEHEEESLVRRVFRLTDRTVGEVMVHRMNVISVSQTATVTDAIEIIRQQRFTRLPVYGEHRENIVGTIHAIDLLLALAGGRGSDPLSAMMRNVIFVPETKLVVDLLEEMRRGGSQLAVVIEEYGSMAGIVTIEDLLEEIVGEIPGESRPSKPLVHLQHPDRIVVDATIDLATLADLFDVRLLDAEANTLGGFIFHHLGSIPEPGTKFSVGDLEFTVEAVVGRRIGRVQIQRRGPRGSQS
ncbi:MAG: HlyC/CorC family transporter [Armatimonadetes bacterium]|nr:HlyC/CorC family transporter [Armatimonadota bacterium]